MPMAAQEQPGGSGVGRTRDFRAGGANRGGSGEVTHRDSAGDMFAAGTKDAPLVGVISPMPEHADPPGRGGRTTRGPLGALTATRSMIARAVRWEIHLQINGTTCASKRQRAV